MKNIADIFAAFVRKDDGSIAVLFAVGLVVLVASAGIAIDYARSVHARTQMQNALDSAVLAGARAESSAQNEVATTMFNANFSDGSAKGVSVSFSATGEGQLSVSDAGMQQGQVSVEDGAGAVTVAPARSGKERDPA